MRLKKKKILVTRPKHQADNLCKLISFNGGEAIAFPTIDIQPIHEPDKSLVKSNSFSGYDFIIFISRNAVERNGGEIPVKTLDQYKSNYSAICHRLTLPGSTVREIAGVDTRGINLSGSLNTTNVPANTNVVLFLEHTSVLQIGKNSQFAVVN